MAVRFEEYGGASSQRQFTDQPAGLMAFVMRTGIVSSEMGAQVVLAIVAIMCASSATLLFINGIQRKEPPTPEQITNMQAAQQELLKRATRQTR